MLRIKALDYFTPFMTRRWDEGWPQFSKVLCESLRMSDTVLIDMDGIKFMSISFFDEIFQRLVQEKFTVSDFDRLQFSEDLDPVYKKHLEYLKTLER